jgi:hypothetical protein
MEISISKNLLHFINKIINYYYSKEISYLIEFHYLL